MKENQSRIILTGSRVLSGASTGQIINGVIARIVTSNQYLFYFVSTVRRAEVYLSFQVTVQPLQQPHSLSSLLLRLSHGALPCCLPVKETQFSMFAVLTINQRPVYTDCTLGNLTSERTDPDPGNIQITEILVVGVIQSSMQQDIKDFVVRNISE